MIARAAKGLEKEKTEELRSLVFRLKDIWRVALNNDEPSKVKSLKLHLIPGAVPRKAKIRRHAPAHLNCMNLQSESWSTLHMSNQIQEVDGISHW